jgi:hypothetical protein
LIRMTVIFAPCPHFCFPRLGVHDQQAPTRDSLFPDQASEVTVARPPVPRAVLVVYQSAAVI